MYIHEESSDQLRNKIELLNKRIAGIDKSLKDNPDAKGLNALHDTLVEERDKLQAQLKGLKEFNYINYREEDTFMSKEYLAVVEEFFDITDHKTRKDVLHINEAEQNRVLTALTGKLYDVIVDKIDDIDFGEIPNTKGDVRKLPNYDKLVDCIEILHQILEQYKQDPTPVNTISNALTNLEMRKHLFEEAFRYNLELPIILYNTICLSIISSVSFMIATCIEFIKTPNQETFSITLDKVALARTKQNLLFINLDKFNKSCKNGDIDKAIKHINSSKTKGVREAALATTLTIAGVSIALIALLRGVIVSLLRELVYFFYYNKSRLSEYFDLQANLLQMNAYNLEANNINISPEEKEKIVKRQMNIVATFRKLADKLAISNKESENKTTREVANANRKLRTDELEDPDIASTGSSLF